jgi:hypothetical protein
LIASKNLGYHSVGGKFDPADRLDKQLKHYKIWSYLKTLLFYSGDPGDLINPVENWGEKVKIIGGCNNLNISRITHPFQTIISALERPTPLDA